MISGFATIDGTANFAKRHSNVAKNHFKNFTGLTLSSIGVGTYLGNPDTLTDNMVKESIKTSIRSGVNVIDTAINYRAQKAERSVGQAISEIIQFNSTHWIHWHIETRLMFVFKTYSYDESFFIRSENSISFRTGIFTMSKFSCTCS